MTDARGPAIECPGVPSGALLSEPNPLISVVTATYNRSQVLRLAIASLRRQTLHDWEQIIIGDACSDDTEQVVAAVADPRLRFVNLKENVGEQSGPNNEGIRLARGRYLAFLNHDDLWLPDHLETLVKLIETRQAHLAFARGIAILPDGSRRLLGGGASGAFYQPLADVHATLWLCRRELFNEVGPWRHSRSCWAAPSQDWLLRAWRLGKKIVASDRVTVIAVHASNYRNCFLERRSTTHETLWQRMESEPDFREREVTAALVAALEHEKSLRLFPHIAGLVRALAYRLLLALGIAPIQAKYRLRSWRRGAYIDRIRRFRGLEVKSRGKK
ncbi:MAG: glycosyltransferase [Candidatus Aminicenantes bacterium]|nr:glycosyltransferase [Candidatus Aminicenantes bacterium]